MKHIFSALVIIALFIGLTLYSSSDQAFAKTIELNYSTSLPPFHVAVKEVMEPWAKMILERTNGEIKVNVVPGGSLCARGQSYNCIENGLVDLSTENVGTHSDRFPLSTVFDLPLLGYSSAKNIGETFWNMYEKFPELKAEYLDVHVLWFGGRPLYQIQTINKPIHTLEDLKGLKLRGTGGTSARVPKMLGAVPIVISAPDTYLAMERGMVAGSMFPWEGVKSFKLYEVVKYHTVANLYGGIDVTAMNKDVWNSLSPENQKIFNELGGAWASSWCSEKWDEDCAKGIALAKKAGNEIYTLPPDEMARWSALLKPIWEEWVNDLEAKGLPSKKIFEEAKRLAK